jgi:hypothetical protein
MTQIESSVPGENLTIILTFVDRQPPWKFPFKPLSEKCLPCEKSMSKIIIA